MLLIDVIHSILVGQGHVFSNFGHFGQEFEK